MHAVHDRYRTLGFRRGLTTHPIILPAALMTGLMVTGPAVAQDADADTETEASSSSSPETKSGSSLPATTVTVSAPPIEGTRQEHTTGAETTITAEQIEDQQIERLEDALRQVPGVTLSGQRAFGLPQAIGLRGMEQRNTRVFVDGIEVSDPSLTQSYYATSDLLMSDIGSIEVLRGARPGRFGADNAGGVINITTKRPTEPFAGEASVEYGSYNTKRVNGMVEGVQGPVDARLSVSAMHTNGYSDFNEDRGGDEDDPYWSWSLNGSVGYQVTDNLRFDVSGHYMRERVSYDSYSYDNDWVRFETERFLRGAATLETLDDTLVHTLAVSDTLTTREYLGDYTDHDTYDGAKTRINYLADWAVTDGVSLSMGADAVNERMESDTPGFTPLTPTSEADTWQEGAFMTLGVTPVTGLDLSASLRGDVHEEFGGAVSYRFGAAYTVEATDTTLRASYATAWQTPSLYERYDPCYGNADLKPETSRGWDIGVDQHLWQQRVTASVTYFETRTQDEIAYDSSIAASSALCYGGGYANIEETFAQGVELGLTAHILPTVDMTVGYTWQNAIDATTEKRLDVRPVNQGTAAVTWRYLPEGTVNVGLRYRDRSTDYNGESDEFWTADARISYDVVENVTLYARMDNIFDADYEEVYGFGTAGRSVYGGIKVRF